MLQRGTPKLGKDGKNAFDDMGVKKLPKVKELQRVRPTPGGKEKRPMPSTGTPVKK